MIPMNTEELTDGLDGYRFFRRGWQCEDEFRETRCSETQLHEAIDAFSRFHLIPAEPEVLLDVSKGGLDLPPVLIVFNDLWYLERQVCCKDEEIPIGFPTFRCNFTIGRASGSAAGIPKT